MDTVAFGTFNVELVGGTHFAICWRYFSDPCFLGAKEERKPNRFLLYSLSVTVDTEVGFTDFLNDGYCFDVNI